MTKYKEIDELVDKAMIDLIMEFPIFAQMLARLGVKCVENPAVKAVAYTDGTGIYVNTPFVDYCNRHPEIITDDGRHINQSMNKKNIVFVLCHELMHILNLTFDRGRKIGIEHNIYGSDPEMRQKCLLWNMATDYEINALLHNNEVNGRRAPLGELSESWLYDSDYIGMVAEKIYEKLYKEYKDKQQEQEKNGSNSCSGGSGNQPGDQSDVEYGEDGLPIGDVQIAIDEHMPFLDDATRSEVINKIGELLDNCSNGTGFSALDRAVEIAHKPLPFNWRRALTKYIKGWVKDNFTWAKPSRAGLANDLILPSQGQTPRLHMAVAVDTSGSISDVELNAMMQHLFTILQQFKDFKIDVWCCGSQVYGDTFRTYTASNKKELAQFPIKSDGGNDMRENFKFLKEHYKGDKPDLFLILSDFYDPLDGDNETTSICPVIGLVIDHPNFVSPKKMKFTAFPFAVENGKAEC